MKVISKAGLLTATFAVLFAVSCSSDKNEDEGTDSSSSGTELSSSSGTTPSSSSVVSSSSGASSSSVATSSSGGASSSSRVSSSSIAANSSSSVAASSSSRASSSSVAANSSSSVAASSSSRASSSSVAASSSSSSVGGGNSFARSYTSVDYAPTGTRRHDRQRYDLQLPSTGDGPFPLVMYVHGGAFTGGNWQLSSNNNGVIQLAKNRGYAVASIGYVLASNSQKAFPESVEDILAAIRHLRANADKYHLDPDRFAITGFSAGGYFTAIICAISGNDAHGYDVTSLGNAGVSHKVQAAASSAALTDFTKLDAHQQELGGSWMMSTHYNSGGNLSQFFGGGVVSESTYGAALTKSNPLTHIKANNANTPPIFMVHGTSDNLVPWKQSELMVDEMNKIKSGNATFEKVSGRSHADFDGATNAITIKVLDFLDARLSSGKPTN